MLSIGGAAYGVSLLVSSFSQLISTVKEGASELPATLKSITGIAEAISSIDPSSTSGLSEAFSSLAESASTFSSSMSDLGDQGGVTDFVANVKTIETSDIENLGLLINEADKMVTVQAKLVALDAATSISSAIDKLVSYVVPDSSDSSSSQREIVLQINDREFGRAVVESLGDDMKLSLA